MPALRLPTAALLFTIAAVSGSANAQTTLRLTWTPAGGSPKVCEYTTDTNGVTMDPATGALLATGSFAGSDCPTATPVSDPQITNGIDGTDIPTATTTGATHSIKWAADADSCSYAGSVTPAAISNWPLTGNVCSNASACATGLTVPVTLPATAGTYKFQLSCNKNGSSVTAVSSQTVSVTTGGGGGDTCVNNAGITRQTFGRVEYNNLDSRDTDLTLFENVFGHNPGGTARQFPGTTNINQRILITRNQYVALKFTVPTTLTLNTFGYFRFEETQPQTARMSYTISKTCGDFATTPTSPMNAKCIVNDGPVNSVLAWGYYPSQGTSMCQLTPGESYYLNIIQAPLSNLASSYCSGTCGDTMQNKKGGGGWPAIVDDQTE